MRTATRSRSRREQTGLDRLVDRVVCSHDFARAEGERRVLGSARAARSRSIRERTLLIEDSVAVLRAARTAYGRARTRSRSAGRTRSVPPREIAGFSGDRRCRRAQSRSARAEAQVRCCGAARPRPRRPRRRPPPWRRCPDRLATCLRRRCSARRVLGDVRLTQRAVVEASATGSCWPMKASMSGRRDRVRPRNRS